MSIRNEFYQAINKANNQKPKKTIKKFSQEKVVSIEEQIQNILNESDSAIINCEVTVNNQPLIDWLYEITKKDDKTLELEKRINQEIDILNKLRDEARKKYNKLNRLNEFNNVTNASSSAAAGAGGGGRIKITVDPSNNSYVVDDYVDDYLV